ncbi:hypothetical protein B0H67DRAFT_303167 [Lasiosphaeris hirsuta]|uniref:Velvet domain-containing protein n=1 Tax=Lasiosphaeris hirsuta TaxID=260670 RepID=A0AA40A9T0_9PEZI|nr:hypothetical protein B0H67DRAFT_303167 [Lasiosphaeris hirsuta]
MSSICVQPPSQATVGTILYPPIVGKFDSAFLEGQEITTAWGILTLIDGSGQVVDSESTVAGRNRPTLDGTPSGMGMYLSDTGGSRRGGGSSSRSGNPYSHFYFKFDRIQINAPGTYSLMIGVYRMSNITGLPEPVTTAETDRVTVHNEQVPAERPSANEQQILSDLRKSFR